MFEEFATLPKAYWPYLIAGSYMAFTCLLMDDVRAAEPLSCFPAPLDTLIAAVKANLGSFTGAGWTQHLQEEGLRHTSLWNGLQPPAPVRMRPTLAASR